MKYLYKKFSEYYDLCYSEKDYAKEADLLQGLFRKYRIKGRRILEVGCGTAGHAVHLEKKGFDIVGVDLHKEMLEIAKKKSRSIKFLQGDMRYFHLKKKFDIVLCLFSTIHYNQNLRELEKTLRNFYRHLEKGGLLIFDMGFNEERWEEGRIYVENWSTNEADLVRFSKSRREGDFGFLDMAYIIFKDKKFHFGEEEHKIGIFRTPKVKRLAERVGFKVDLYEIEPQKSWQENPGKYTVFACVKK